VCATLELLVKLGVARATNERRDGSLRALM
jgi:hypothetical protein